MRNSQCEMIDKFAMDVSRYFQAVKKERELTREETRLMFSGLTVRQMLTSYSLRKMEKQEVVRDAIRERSKEQLFKLNKVVYEGIVSDIYEPVYAKDLTDLRRKMSKRANTIPQMEDFAKVIVYVNGDKSEEQTWTRKNEWLDLKWSFGAWFRINSK